MNKQTLTSPALLGAYRKGRDARRAGDPRTSCPYKDKRGGHHGHVVTFSRAFMRMWRDGWDDERASVPERYCIRRKTPPA